MTTLEEIQACVMRGDREGTVSGVQQALDQGMDPGAILNQAMIPAMAEVGRLFECGEYYVPEMMIAARAMKAGLELLKPLLVQSGAEPLGRVAIGTVKGDLHDIGKNLVAMMLEGAGFSIHDLGVDVGPEKFVRAAEEGAQIVAMSALLTTTMPGMKATIEALQTAGLRGRVKVMVGGAPLTQAYADQIGADAFAPDASSATRVAKQLIGV